MRVNTGYINSTRGPSSLLYLCDVFRVLISSLVCQFCAASAVGLFCFRTQCCILQSFRSYAYRERREGSLVSATLQQTGLLSSAECAVGLCSCATFFRFFILVTMILCLFCGSWLLMSPCGGIAPGGILVTELVL